MLTRLEINPNSGELLAGFRNLGTIIFPGYKEHEFITRNLGHAKDPRAKQKAKELIEQLRAIPELEQYIPVVHDKYWVTLGLKCPVRLKHLLPDIFETGHYTQEARWSFASPGDFIPLDSGLVSLLEERQRLSREIEGFQGQIQTIRTRNYASRTFNDLNELFSRKNYSSVEEVLSAASQVSSLKKLPREFFVKRLELEKQIQELGQTAIPQTRVSYSKIRNKEEERKRKLRVEQQDYSWLASRRAPTSQELLDRTWLLLDSEAPMFMRKDPTTTSIGAALCKNGKMLKQVIFEETQLGLAELEGFQIFDGLGDVVGSFANFCITENPDITSSYNTRYDLIAFRESEAGFPVGEDKTPPVFKATVKAFERIGIKNMLVVDLMRWAQIARAYDINAKLEMTAGFEKPISYKELEELHIKALNGDREAARQKTSYLVSDVQNLFKLYASEEFAKNLEDACWISQNFGVGIERLLHTSRNVNDVQEKGYFQALGIYRDMVQPHMHMTTMKRMENAGMACFMRQIVQGSVEKPPVQNTRGVFNNVYKVHIPIGDFFRELIARNFPEVEGFYQYQERFRDDKKRLFFLEQFGKAFASWLMRDYGLYVREVTNLKFLLKEKNLPPVEFEEAYTYFRKNLVSACRTDEEARKGLEELNKGNIAPKYCREFSTTKVKAFLRKYNLTASDKRTKERDLDFGFFATLANHRSKTRRWARNVRGNYGVYVTRESYANGEVSLDPNILVIDEQLDLGFNFINTFLRKNNLEVLCQEGFYLYLTGDKKALEARDCPLTLVDEIPVLFNSDNPYYEKFGYMSHMRLEDDPGYNLSVFEMTAFGDMIRKASQRKNGEAKNSFHSALRRIKTEKIPIRDLLFYNKSKEQYAAFVTDSERKDGKFYFTPNDPNAGLKEGDKRQKEIKYDEKMDLHYYVESDEESSEVEKALEERELIVRNKERRVYIASFDMIKPDMNRYAQRLEKRGKKILEPILKQAEVSRQQQMQLQL